MAVEYPFGFIVGNTDPIDSRFRFATLVERDALSVYNRYEGLTTYVAETETKYILKGGIANENWEEDGGGSSGGGATVVADFSEMLTIPSEDRHEGMIVLVMFDRKNYQLKGGTTNSDWKLFDESVDVQGTHLNLLTDGSFEDGATDGWQVTGGSATIEVTSENVLTTPTNTKCLKAVLTTFDSLKHGFSGIPAQYDAMKGELRMLLWTNGKVSIRLRYDDGVDLIDVVYTEINTNSSWKSVALPFKFPVGYPLTLFIKPTTATTTVYVDEVFMGVKDGVNSNPVVVGSNQIDWAQGDIFYKELTATTSFDFENFEMGRCISVILRNTTGANVNISFGATIIKKTADFPTLVEANKTTVITFISAGGYAFAAQIKELA